MKRRQPGSPSVACAYIRVSCDTQDLGPAAQKEAITRWATSRNITIASWHQDIGVSGGTDIAGRPGLLEALGTLRQHGAGVLVAARRDRLARSVVVSAGIEAAAAREGAAVLTADGSSDGNTPEAQLMKGILDNFSQYERAVIRSRIVAALGVKRARGERLGGIRYGYRVARDGRHRLVKGSGLRGCSAECGGCLMLEPDPGEQDVIARVREIRASTTLRGAVIACAEAGLVSRVGRPFALTQIARMSPSSASA